MHGKSLLLPIFAAAATGVAAQNSGTFKAMTYNVAGLPAFLSSGDPSANTAELAKRLHPYDIVNMQEDFNYHAVIYANDDHTYRTATSGGAGIGSGLNSISWFPWTDFERVKWNDCYGGLDHGSDCLTPKGYTFMRMRLAEGVFVDVYNLHTDADTGDQDEAARRSNILQVAAAVNSRSAGHAVLVLGDTNSRYSRALDNIAELTKQAGLTDTWIQLVRGSLGAPAAGNDIVCDEFKPTNSCEVVDKIFYKGSPAVQLTAIQHSNEHYKFTNATGARLSDHFPIAATFTWSNAATPARLSDYYGGPHGDWFSDLTASVSKSTVVTSFTITGEKRIDSVTVVRKASATASSETLRHGGTGGTASTLTLNANEHVVQTRVCQGKYSSTTRIFYLQLITNTGRTVANGATTSECVTYNAPTGFRVVGFYGRTGDNIDQIGLVYAPLP
ncbi:endonuclease/exonuclease/phosphatase family protein [Cladochytrium replicatum]|nr:endonuclease/exonuclease/phosphatase family protein [Cladochytrium replicatum]